MPPFLPPEPIDHIISCVNDPHDLCQCALVCRSWMAASMCGIYRTITLLSPGRYELLDSRVLRNQSSEAYGWLTMTRTLVYHVNHINQTEPRLNDWYPFVGLAGHLPHLRSIRLQHFYLRQEANPRLLNAFTCFSSVRELHLHWCIFPTFDSFRRILTSLPSLTDLQFHSVEWESSASRNLPLFNFPQRRPKLQSLKVNIMPEEEDSKHFEFFSWLLRTPSRDSIRELSVYQHFHSWSRFVKMYPYHIDFLNSIGPSVQKLHLTVPFKRFPIEPFTSLQRVSISVDPVQGQWSLMDTYRLLRRVSSPLVELCLRGVFVEAHNPTLESTAKTDHSGSPTERDSNRLSEPSDSLRKIDELLSGNGFRSLKRVEFGLRKAHRPNDKHSLVLRRGWFLEDIREKLPNLRARNVEISVDRNDFPEPMFPEIAQGGKRASYRQVALRPREPCCRAWKCQISRQRA